MGTVEQVESHIDETIEPFIHDLCSRMEEEGNRKTVEKVREAFRKLQEGHLHVGFCGLFSAGKSTMINHLLEQSLLPSSPIPTSANVVHIRYGRPQAQITFSSGEKRTLEVSDLERWKEYCRDGEKVTKVDIFHPHPLLEEGVHYLDTPGIDSNDALHQQATEEALHLADVVIFVTDYHHVQSEFNFSFMKSLKEKGKSLFLVINQIDKHQQEELSFTSFQERVKAGLNEWGVSVDGLLCTSLKEPRHPLNQFPHLTKILKQAREQKEMLIQRHFFAVLKTLLDEHQRFLLQKQEGTREGIHKDMDRLKQLAEYEEYPALLDQFEQSRVAPEDWQEDVEQETEKIVQNAIITPYTTTRLAQSLIESMQDDFKVGWLFSAKKTEAERRNRLELLYEDLTERVTSQVEWHLKEMLRKKAERYNMEDPDFLTELMEWNLTFPKEWLTELIKQKVTSSEYVYTYTKELAHKVHALYLKKVKQLAQEGKSLLQEQHVRTYEPLQKRIQQYQQIKEKELLLKNLTAEIDEQMAVYQRLMEDMKHEAGDLSADRVWIDQAFLDQVREDQMEESFSDSGLIPTKKTSVSTAEQAQSHGQHQSPEQYQFSGQLPSSMQYIPASEMNHGNVSESKKVSYPGWDQQAFQQMAGTLNKAADLLERIPSFSSVARGLREKAERLQTNRFRICLFGAFSAGKSSFANALIGDRLLPVSPNPTTAAINYILPATEECPPHTAVVSMKSREQVEEEIALSLGRLHLSTKGTIEDQLEQVQAIQAQDLRSSLKPYYSFLQACRQGWTEAKKALGQQFKVDREQFHSYVAEEKKACFVQDIQFYQDSELGRQGLELIDTPGADSIYARHTDVTFNFLKNADVILYLTYYNHAFSRADRQFLDQLGRVKDQFALDKMFFVINASDLAESKQELKDVHEHVQEELLRSGIRFPRIFAVSSLRALRGHPDSGMDTFREAFFNFIDAELVQLLLKSAQTDVEQGYRLLQNMQEELSGSAEVREAKMAALQEKKGEWLARMEAEKYSSFLKEMDQEVEELFYYVKQRLSFAFREHVHEAFHPSVLRGEQASKKQLHLCLDEVLFSLVQQLQDECKATALRLENVLQRLRERALGDWQQIIAKENLVLTGSALREIKCDLPPIPDRFPLENVKELEHCLRHFKNPKQFFEQEGKKKLYEELEPQLEGLVEQYVHKTVADYQTFYRKEWDKVEHNLKDVLQEELHVVVSSRLSGLSGELSMQDLDRFMLHYREEVVGEAKQLIETAV